MDNNMELNYDTEYINEEIGKCETVAEFKESIIPLLKSQQVRWAERINKIIEDNGYTKIKFAELCNVSRVTVDKWCKGAIPNSREKFIKIGLAANYGIDEMNMFLQRFGRYPELYSKSLEDCVCIYVIKNVADNRGEYYDKLLEQTKEMIERPESLNVIQEEDYFAETEYMDKQLDNADEPEKLRKFFSENTKAFASAYNKLYSYVIAFLEANYVSEGFNVYNLAESQGWSSSLVQSVSAIRQKKWYPTRNKIISIGLHLNMDHDQVDDMLRCAHMEPLYAKNIFESVIIFILEYAEINDIIDEDVDMVLQLAGKIMNEIDIPEIDEFISELPDEE